MTFPRIRRAAGLAVVLALTSGVAAACGSAQAAPRGPAPYHLSSRDIGWLNAAHQANEAEIQGGQYAETNTTTADIQAAGATMVRDHTASDAKLIQLAGKLHIGLVQYLTDQQIETADQLSSALGTTFNDEFIGAMLTAHHQMITATEAEIRQGSSPQVVALARQTLPVLEKHLMMLRAIGSSG